MSTAKRIAIEISVAAMNQSKTPAPGVDRIVVAGIPSRGVCRRSISQIGMTASGMKANRIWPVCQTRTIAIATAPRNSGTMYASQRRRVSITFFGCWFTCDPVEATADSVHAAGALMYWVQDPRERPLAFNAWFVVVMMGLRFGNRTIRRPDEDWRRRSSAPIR